MLFTKSCATKPCKMHCMQLLRHISWHWSNMLMQYKGCPAFSHASRHFYVLCRGQETWLLLFTGTVMLPSQVWECYYMLFLSITEPKLHMRKTSCNHHGVVCQVLLLSQRPSWSSTGALAEEAAAEGVFFLQGEEEDDSKRRAARLQRGMFMHPNLTLAAALGKPVQLCRVWPA